MQLPVVEKKKANQIGKVANILEVSILPLDPQRITELLNILKAHSQIDTIWLMSEIANSMITTEFSKSLIELLKKTLQITRVIYKNCKISADAHLAIEKELSINKEVRSQALTSSMTFQNHNSNLIVFEKSKIENTITLVVSKINDPTLANFSNALKMEILLGNLKKVSLKLDDFNLTSLEDIDLLTNLCEEFPEITGLEFKIELNNPNVLLNVNSALKKLLGRLESLSVHILGQHYKLDEQFLSILANSNRLQNLYLDNLIISSTSNLYEILHKNILIKLEIDLGGTYVPVMKEFIAALKNNTSLRSLTFSDVEYATSISQALQLHPNIQSLRFNKILNQAQLEAIFHLIEINSSLESLSLPLTELDEAGIILFNILSDNNSLRELNIGLHYISSRQCALAFTEMLRHNHTLNTLNFGQKEVSLLGFDHLTHTQYMTTLEMNFPEKSFIRKLYLPLQFDTTLKSWFKGFLTKITNSSPLLTELKLEEGDIDGSFSVGKNIEKLKVGGCTLTPDIKEALHLNERRNKAVHAIETAKKVFKLGCDNSTFSKQLQNYGIKLLTDVLQDLKNYSAADLNKLKIQANFLLGQFYLSGNDRAHAYSYFRDCDDLDPKATAELIIMLYGEEEQSYVELAAATEAFKFSTTELQQFFLILMSYCDIKDVRILGLLPRILTQLHKMTGHNGTILIDKYNAVVPISDVNLTKIARTIASKQSTELAGILDDKKLSYVNRFRLSRIHPLIVAHLNKEYGSAQVICFEDLIVNYEKPYTVFNFNETWADLYRDYQEGKLYSTIKDDDKNLETIRLLATHCLSFFDHLYLAKYVCEQATRDENTFELLVTFASAEIFPWIDNFIASIYAQKNDSVNAAKYYLKAAKLGDFSAIKEIKRGATTLAPYTIEIFTNPSYLEERPKLTLFLADCYLVNGKPYEAFELYKKAHLHFPEIAIEKIKRLAKQNLFATAFLETINPKPVSLLVFIGDSFAKRLIYKKALEYYTLADPHNNPAVFTAIQKLADERACPEAIICTADLYKATYEKFPQDQRLLEFAFEYNYRAAKLNYQSAIEFLKKLTLNKDVPIDWLYSIAGIMDTHNPALAKELLLGIKDKHPAAKLEAIILVSPPRLGERESVLNFREEKDCVFALENYFKNFPKSRLATQNNIANKIVEHFNVSQNQTRPEALAWLREYVSKPDISPHIHGELARMLSCAIFILKNWQPPFLDLSYTKNLMP